MCQICHHMPCLSQCPNAPEDAEVYKCADCSEGINVGEEYVEIDDSYYHLDCIKGKSVVELLEMIDITVKEASDDANENE